MNLPAVVALSALMMMQSEQQPKSTLGYIQLDPSYVLTNPSADAIFSKPSKLVDGRKMYGISTLPDWTCEVLAPAGPDPNIFMVTCIKADPLIH